MILSPFFLNQGISGKNIVISGKNIVITLSQKDSYKRFRILFTRSVIRVCLLVNDAPRISDIFRKAV